MMARLETGDVLLTTRVSDVFQDVEIECDAHGKSVARFARPVKLLSVGAAGQGNIPKGFHQSAQRCRDGGAATLGWRITNRNLLRRS